jgi:two-component system CheB/CheR fusion protein
VAKPTRKNGPPAKRKPVKRAAAKVAGAPASETALTHKEASRDDALFPIVGVGASAGGLEAFSELLRALPENPGLAIVFVQHLDPKHVSVLAELLKHEASMPVEEAGDGVRVERDHVYVIPRNRTITVNKGVLSLGPRDAPGHQLTSIDLFFRSLAADQGIRSIGVVLSGSASDGALGLQAVKAAGGITFAQKPHTAKFDGMPRAAIDSGAVDFVGSPREIAAQLLQFRRLQLNASAVAHQVTMPAADTVVSRILSLVRTATGVDFSQYKPNTIQRRILRRAVLRRLESLEKYLDLLQSDPHEVEALYQDLLINVTEFFRDPETFRALQEQIFPRIIEERKRHDRQIRIWVPGCSTGEEVYSLAISLLEFLGDKEADLTVQIFATDINEAGLQKARAGIYPANAMQRVSPERLRRFFVSADGGSYQIQKRVRELCIFARHNLATDPPFSRLDLISCRNLLIYLGPALQERVMAVFHYALKPHGILMLGSSETVGPHADMFQILDKKHKFFERRPVPSRVSFSFSMEQSVAEKKELHERAEALVEFDTLRETDRLLLARYAPPGVVVDEEMNILQFRGQTSRFLEPASGAASLNLLRMLKQGLAVEVKNALTKARKQNVTVRRERIPLTGNGLINVEVMPFKHVAGQKRKYLIVFEQEPPAEPSERRGRGRRESSTDKELTQENAGLRHELATTKEYLQSIIEDQEAAHEELRSAAEEIQSSNEELQSTNEELETAKEELQSTNEELNTLNEELQNRNAQLTQMSNDLLNVLANVNMAIVILGNGFRIRRFTPLAEKALNLIPSDIGRSILDLNLRIPVPNLPALLDDVVTNLTPKALEVTDPEGRIYSLRVRPYRTEDNKIDGVVLLFIDMDPTTIHASPSALHDSILTTPAGARLSLLSAQEEERRRLSRELHDELNQKLALLEFTLQSLESDQAQPEDRQRDLSAFRKMLAEFSEDLRRLAYQLHPSIVEDLGLVTAVQSYCEDFSKREGIEVRFQAGEFPSGVAMPVALVLYRVLQEALRNVAKHSGAHLALVELTAVDDHVKLTVRDTGRGFHPDPAKIGLGMTGIRERVALVGGKIEWLSKPGDGTTVTVVTPVNPDLGPASFR